jgi:hypothetical protein
VRTDAERIEAMSGIATRLEYGVSLADAARAQGVPPDTAKSWLRRGRAEQTGPYADFAAATKEARDRVAEQTPLDYEELRKVVARAARAGSVQAMRLWWELLRETAEETAAAEEDDPFAEFDELARQRAARERGTW